MHSLNIEHISSTNSVLKLVKSNDFNELHLLNIYIIFVTCEVSNLEKSILIILDKSENIQLQFVIFEFHFIVTLFISSLKL